MSDEPPAIDECLSLAAGHASRQAALGLVLGLASGHGSGEINIDAPEQPIPVEAANWTGTCWPKGL
jgi:hypothetical protein